MNKTVRIVLILCVAVSFPSHTQHQAIPEHPIDQKRVRNSAEW